MDARRPRHSRPTTIASPIGMCLVARSRSKEPAQVAQRWHRVRALAARPAAASGGGSQRRPVRGQASPGRPGRCNTARGAPAGTATKAARCGATAAVGGDAWQIPTGEEGADAQRHGPHRHSSNGPESAAGSSESVSLDDRSAPDESPAWLRARGTGRDARTSQRAEERQCRAVPATPAQYSTDTDASKELNSWGGPTASVRAARTQRGEAGGRIQLHAIATAGHQHRRCSLPASP